LHSKQSSNINQILSEATAFKQNLILIQKIAVTATNISNDLNVNSKGKKRTETTNGLVTPKATLDVNNSRVDAKKARQAAAVTDQDLTKTENHYSSNKSDTNNNKNITKDRAKNNKIL
jgi:hypothetical protein